MLSPFTSNCLAITEIDHPAGTDLILGSKDYETADAWHAAYNESPAAAIPANVEYELTKFDTDFSIVGQKLVTRETAEKLFGKTIAAMKPDGLTIHHKDKYREQVKSS